MTMITPSYLGETIEYSSLHACRSTLEDPTPSCSANSVSLSDTSANGNGHIGFSCQGTIADLSISGGTFNNNTGGTFTADCNTNLGPYYGFGIELRQCVGIVEYISAEGNGFSGPDIVDGDYGAEGGAGVIVKGNSNDITIMNANLEQNMNGLWIEDPDSVENWGACDGGGVGTVEILFSHIVDNQEFGVLNCCTNEIAATHNWWGDASGPSNSPGSGDAVSGTIDYDPWLGSPLDEVLYETINGSGTMVDTSTGGQITINGVGEHTITTASYDEKPAGAKPFSNAGKYYDVHLDSADNVNSIVIQFCPAMEGEVIKYWNGASWVEASNQSYAGGCIAVTITDETTPNLDALTGTPFGQGFTAPVGGEAYPVNGMRNAIFWFAPIILLVIGIFTFSKVANPIR